MKRVYDFKIKTNNPEKRWVEKDYPGYLHMIFSQAYGAIFKMQKKWPYGFKIGYVFSGKGRIDWFWDLRELEKVRHLFLEKSKKDLKFFRNIYRTWEKDCKKYLFALKQALKKDISRLSDKKLYVLYKKIYELNTDQAATGYLADVFLTNGETDWYADLLLSLAPKYPHPDELIKTLTLPAIPTYSNEEETSLKKAAKRIVLLKPELKSRELFVKWVKGTPKALGLIRNHYAKFFWVENNYFAKELTLEHFVAKAYEIIKNKSFSFPDFNKAKKQKTALLKKINNPRLILTVTMSEMATHIQDYRKMSLVRFSHFLHVVFLEMAKRTGLQELDFQNLAEPEIYDVFINRKWDNKLLLERRNRSFAFFLGQKYGIYIGRDIKKYVNESEFRETEQAQAELKGMSACPGLAKGKARVIFNTKYIRGFKRGDILVTNNTTPEFVPLMKLAAAIVTEQGGITTHAAIVSRELGIPCIIGTKIATKVLKDGDMVEVDANKGIVRKL